MKLTFEGEGSDFYCFVNGLLSAAPAKLDSDPRIKLVLEAINQNGIGVQVYEETMLDDILTLRRNILAEKDCRIKYQDLAYEAMNFIDRMLGGKTNVEDFKDRLKQVQAILTDPAGDSADPSWHPPDSREVHISDPLSLHHTAESQTPSPGECTPASESRSELDPF